MALSNLVVTVGILTAAYVMLRGDVRQSSAILKRNVGHIREWLKEEANASRAAEKGKSKELEVGAQRDIPKDEKH